MTSPRLLSRDAFGRARAFLQNSAPLDRALFAFYFESAPSTKARDELKPFQNADGGFGGREPDIGFSESSVLSTCHALHQLHELGAATDDPAVQRALDYLQATYDDSTTTWAIIPPHDNTQPHAPWWHWSDQLAANFGYYRDNPRPDVLACLYHFPCAHTVSLRKRAGAALTPWLHGNSATIDMNGLACYVRLHAAPDLPADLKQELDRQLPGVISRCVERDSTKWTGYALRPLEVAPFADSPWRVQLDASIDDNLDYLITEQGADGSWSPFWTWGDAFPEAWPAAKKKWQAQLTLKTLRALKSYGRLA